MFPVRRPVDISRFQGHNAYAQLFSGSKMNLRRELRAPNLSSPGLRLRAALIRSMVAVEEPDQTPEKVIAKIDTIINEIINIGEWKEDYREICPLSMQRILDLYGYKSIEEVPGSQNRGPMLVTLQMIMYIRRLALTAFPA